MFHPQNILKVCCNIDLFYYISIFFRISHRADTLNASDTALQQVLPVISDLGLGEIHTLDLQESDDITFTKDSKCPVKHRRRLGRNTQGREKSKPNEAMHTE